VNRRNFITFEDAYKQFKEWYENCLENGIEPEKVVEKVGEMMLLVNEDQIKAYNKGIEDLEG
jgi:predicted HicB family RNase H-like nuclease